MLLNKPISINSGSFVFCRYSIALLLCLACIFKIKVLVLIVFIIFVSSAILKIKNAPLIFISTFFFEKILKIKNQIIDENDMFFIHTMASLFSAFCLSFLYVFDEKIGWYITIVFSIMKIISAIGFCPAKKIRSFLFEGKSNTCYIKKR